MTYQEFLDEVEKVKGPWMLYKGRITLARDPIACPAISIEKKLRRCSLDFLLSDIWNAADNDKGHDPQIRKDLLRVCKLEEFNAFAN